MEKFHKLVKTIVINQDRNTYEYAYIHEVPIAGIKEDNILIATDIKNRKRKDYDQNHVKNFVTIKEINKSL